MPSSVIFAPIPARAYTVLPIISVDCDIS